MRDLAPSNEGKRRGLYLEVCVIDAFKDECWRSGLYSHHREHEKGVERNQEEKQTINTTEREIYKSGIRLFLIQSPDKPVIWQPPPCDFNPNGTNDTTI